MNAPKKALALPLSHLSTSPRFTTLWQVGTAIHNFARCDSQLGPLDSQLDSHLLAGEMAPMAISVARSPFSRSIMHVNKPSSTPSTTFRCQNPGGEGEYAIHICFLAPHTDTPPDQHCPQAGSSSRSRLVRCRWQIRGL